MSGGTAFLEESLLHLAQNRLQELLGVIANHYWLKNDMVNAAIYAMVLRQLFAEGYSGPFGSQYIGPYMELNKLFGMEPQTYLYQACDSLLKMVKDELARHNIT